MAQGLHDIHNPPKSYLYPEKGYYVHQEFPKTVYMKPAEGQHPNEAHKVVKDAEELEMALADGYELKPVYPVVESKKGRK